MALELSDAEVFGSGSTSPPEPFRWQVLPKEQLERDRESLRVLLEEQAANPADAKLQKDIAQRRGSIARFERQTGAQHVAIAPRPEFNDEEVFGKRAATPEGQLTDEQVFGPKATWGEVFKSLPAQMVAGVESATAGTRYAGEEQTAKLQARAAEQGLPPDVSFAPGVQVKPPSMAQPADVEGARRAVEGAEKTRAAVTPQRMSIPQEAVSSLAQSAPATLTGLAAGIATRNPLVAFAIGGGGGALMEGGTTYSEARAKGASPDRALTAASVNALLEGGGEILGLKVATAVGTPIFKRLLQTVAAEAGQEIGTQGLQDLNAKLLYDPDLTLEQALRNLAVAGLAGAGGGALYGGPGQVLAGITERQTPEQQLLAQIRSGDLAEAARVAAEGLPSSVQPVLVAKAAFDQGELTQQQFADFRRALIAEAVTKESPADIREVELRRRLTEEAVAHDEQPYNPTAEELSELESANRGQVQPNTELAGYYQRLAAGEIDRFEAQRSAYSNVPRATWAMQEYQRAVRQKAEGLYPYAPVARIMEHAVVPAALVGMKPGEVRVNWGPGGDLQAASAAQNYLQQMIKRFAPAMRVTLERTPLPSLGRIRAYRDDTYEIALDPSLSESEVVGSITHELGHALGDYLLRRSPERVQTAVMRAWARETEQLRRTGSTEDFYRQQLGPQNLERAREAGPDFSLSKPLQERFSATEGIAGETWRSYVGNFEEWLAHQLERAAASDYVGMGRYVQAFFKKYAAMVKRMVEATGEKFLPSMKWQQFINYHALRYEEQRLTAERQDRVARRLAEQEMDLSPAEVAELDRFLQDSLAGNPIVQETVLKATPSIRTKIAQLFKRLGAREAQLLVPDPMSPVQMSAEDLLEDLADNELPGQKPNEGAQHADVVARQAHLFVTLTGEPVVASGGMDAHGNFLQAQGIPNDDLQAVAAKGWIYLDSGGETPLLISDPTLNTKEQVEAAAQAYSDRIGHPVEIAFGTERYRVNRPLSMDQRPPETEGGGRISRTISSLLGRGPVDTGELRGDLDRFSWASKWFHTLEQIGYRNPHIAQLQRYIGEVRKWANTRMQWMGRSDSRLRQWADLSREDRQNLAQLLFDSTLADSYFNLNDPTVRAKYPLSARALEVYNGIRQDFEQFLTAVEESLLQQAALRLAGNPIALAQEQARIRERFGPLHDRPYFPLTRFGENLVIVKAQSDGVKYAGKTFSKGDVMHLEAFESATEARAAAAQMRRQFPSASVKLDKVSKAARSFMGLPGPIVEALKYDPSVNLSDEQRRALDEYLYKIAPGQSFVKHLIRRKGIQGFSEDAMRAYANYFFHGASHIARIQHASQMADAVNSLRATADQLQFDAVKRRDLVNYANAHLSELLNPATDWAQARSLVAVSYLGYSLSSAMVNLTQVPMVTYPHLAAMYGDVAATGALRRAYGDVMAAFRATAPLTQEQQKAAEKWANGVPLSAAEHKSISKMMGLSSGKLQMLRTGQLEGWLDESFATELAATSEGGWLNRYKSTSDLAYYGRLMMHYGMVPFQAAEKLNRRVTALARYELAIKNGATQEQATEMARDSVSRTQFEYAKWNRPELLRGRRGIILMFMQFQLNMLYFAAGGDKGFWRWWLLMLAAVGPMGLPFAENLADLATWIFSRENQRVNARYEVRKWAERLGELVGIKPDMLMHGLSRRGFGAALFDVSGTLGMGRIIPGTELLASTGDFQQRLQQGVTEAGGASASLVMRLLQGATSSDMSTLKRIEMLMPFSALQRAMQALRWASYGAEETRSGADVVTFDTNDPWELTEIVGRGIVGLMPRAVAEGRPERGELGRDELRLRQDFANYYRVRREVLLRKYDQAAEHGDNEDKTLSIDAIRKYNDEVPVPALRITGKELQASRKARERGRALQERGFGQGRGEQGIWRDVGDRRL